MEAVRAKGNEGNHGSEKSECHDIRSISLDTTLVKQSHLAFPAADRLDAEQDVEQDFAVALKKCDQFKAGMRA